MTKIKCPYCTGHAHIEDTKKIYKVASYGKAFICENFPTCDTYVGVHKGTLNALGTLANEELRTLRKMCHRSFDPLWRKLGLKRKEAYHKLGAKLGLTKAECHFAMFSITQCKIALPEIAQLKYELLNNILDDKKDPLANNLNISGRSKVK